jgi:hypothetical protein
MSSTGVVVVVDLDLVEDVRIEREVVRAIARFEQRIDADDHRHLRRAAAVIAAEGVEVGDVGLVVERGDRCFAVVGRVAYAPRRGGRGGPAC